MGKAVHAHALGASCPALPEMAFWEIREIREMKDALEEYRLALADFSQPGARWGNIGRLTVWGRKAGLTADEIVDAARAAGVKDRDADIRRGWESARPPRDAPRNRYTPRMPRPTPRTFPGFVRSMIEAGGGEADAEAVRALSPYYFPRTANPRLAQTAAFLRLFDPADLLFIFRDDAPAAGRRGVNLRTAAEWLEIVENGGDLPGDLVCPNPFTGAEGLTTDGKPSLVAQTSIARFPFLIVEFDDLPLPGQCAFWRGFLTRSPLARAVASITYSGGKSLHALLHFGCATLAEWTARRDQLRRFLAADPDPVFRADEQAMRPRTGTRLPGVVRFSSGRVQELLYLNPAATR